MQKELDIDDPVAVLLSTNPQQGHGWLKVRSHSCGGFSCDSFDGYAYVLPVLPEKKSLIKTIAYEEFGDGEISLDYGVTSDDRSAYKKFLLRNGLTVSNEYLRGLTQAIYPMDASAGNLQVLTGMANVQGIELNNLRIAVLGNNCD